MWMEQRRGMIHNVATGAAVGIVTGFLYVLLAIVLVLLSGGEAGLLARHQIRFWELILLYFAGGLMGGVVWGLLRPLNRSLLGAMLNGYFVALPVFMLTSWLLTRRWVDDQHWLGTAVAVALLASLAGALAGGGCWLYYRGDRALPLDDLWR